MGRGRAKAKQTKVARELKYHSPNTDLAALQRELGCRRITSSMRLTSRMTRREDEFDEDDEDDEAANWARRSS